MDPLTHATLGAAAAAAVAPSHQRRLVAVVAGLSALLPDADTLIDRADDPLLVLDFHRHFTHALAFTPVIALLAAGFLWLVWPRIKRELDFWVVFRAAFIGVLLAPLLDACTSYGTHLWLPFSEAKAAWNLIAVFDPAFTLLLLVPLAITLRRPQRNTVRVGLLLAACYLTLGYVQQQRVLDSARTLATRQGHAADRLSAKPTLANLLLWRAIYEHDGRIHAVAVHAGRSVRAYPGANAPLLRDTGDVPSERHGAVERFRRFADDWLVVMADGSVGDARYAMLPTDIAPIWFIAWDAAGSLRFQSRHDMTKAQRQNWLAMLRGGD
jgi:inner membrane protein